MSSYSTINFVLVKDVPVDVVDRMKSMLSVVKISLDKEKG